MKACHRFVALRRFAFACGAAIATLVMSRAEGIDRLPLSELLARIPAVANDGLGVGVDQQQLAKQIQAYGAEAIAPMLEQLWSSNHAAREFAGYVVRDLDGLSEAHLDALIAAAKAGNGWIPPAIARIGTPRAMDFLLSAFKQNPEFGTQYTYALTFLGEKAVPGLLEIFRSSPAPELVGAGMDPFEQILADKRGAGAAAVPGLRAMLRDQTLGAQKRRQVIHILGAIGPDAINAASDLKVAAASNEGEFSREVTEALTGMGSADAIPDLLRSYRVRPNPYTLSSLASLGSLAREAGPAVAKTLADKNAPMRVDAVRALGYIGYSEAISELQSLLAETDDWQLVYAAAEALGRMKATAAISALNNVAQHHWFPPVRTAAARALRAVHGQSVYQPHAPGSSYWEMMMDFSNEGATPRMTSAGAGNRRFRKEPGTLSARELKGMRYESPKVIASENIAHRVCMETVEPTRGLRVSGGYLLGSDVGEFGGELGYRDVRGITRTLVPKNVHGIHPMPFGIVVTTGLAHLGGSHGTAWLVQVKPGAAPTVKPFKRLPGAPRESGILENGDLFIACNGGDVIITCTGDIRMADPDVK